MNSGLPFDESMIAYQGRSPPVARSTWPGIRQRYGMRLYAYQGPAQPVARSMPRMRVRYGIRLYIYIVYVLL